MVEWVIELEEDGGHGIGSNGMVVDMDDGCSNNRWWCYGGT